MKLWPVVKRFGPYVLVGGLIVYVIAGPHVGPTGEAIPKYAVSASESRAEPRLRMSRGRDAHFGLWLTPATPPATKVAVYLFAASANRDADLEPVDAKVELAPDGRIRMIGSARDRLEGASEVRVVIGAPSAFARFDDAAARAKNGQTDAFVQVTVLPIDRE